MRIVGPKDPVGAFGGIEPSFIGVGSPIWNQPVHDRPNILQGPEEGRIQRMENNDGSNLVRGGWWHMNE
jgi:hypothetical protein